MFEASSSVSVTLYYKMKQILSVKKVESKETPWSWMGGRASNLKHVRINHCTFLGIFWGTHQV